MNTEQLQKWIVKNRIIVGICSTIVVIIIFAALWFLTNKHKSIDFKLNDPVIEYGEDVKEIDWARRATTDARSIIADIDTMKIGEFEVEFYACINDTCDTVIQTVTIKDTKAPEIVVKDTEMEIKQNTEFDPANYIESVKDIVDGDIKYSEKEVEKDGYYITGEIDTAKAGEYTIKIIAVDKHGNKTEKECKITVKGTVDVPVTPPAQEPQQPAPQPEPNDPEPEPEKVPTIPNEDGGASDDNPDAPSGDTPNNDSPPQDPTEPTPPHSTQPDAPQDTPPAGS